MSICCTRRAAWWVVTSWTSASKWTPRRVPWSPRLARQRQHLQVAAGASLEWLPQESIAFDGARVAASTHVSLHGDARFIGWEILCLGRPASGERFTTGEVSQTWEIRRDGQLLFIERAVYAQDGEALTAAWGLAGRPVCGSLICVGDHAARLDALHEAAADLGIEGLFSVTQLDGVLVARYLGRYSDEARRCFMRCWEMLRPDLLRRAACIPRIWAT
jgi:urease accessory protein